MSSTQRFCFWAAKSYPDTIAIIVKQVIIIVVFFMTINNIRIHLFAHTQIKKILSSRTKNLLVIFSLIILWGLFQTSQNIYSIYIFFQYIFPLQNDEDIDMTQQSIIYVFLDFFPGFIIQTLFIIIPYVFIRNILSQLPVQIFKYFYQLKLKPFVQIWMIIRLLIHLSLAFLLLLISRQYLQLINMIDIYFLLTDETIIFIIILLCKRWYINKVPNLNMKIYYLIIIIGTLKVMTDFLFLILFQDDQTKCISQFSQHLNYSVGNQIIGAIITHFCPVFAILFLYKYNDIKKQTLIEQDITSQSVKE